MLAITAIYLCVMTRAATAASDLGESSRSVITCLNMLCYGNDPVPSKRCNVTPEAFGTRANHQSVLRILAFSVGTTVQNLRATRKRTGEHANERDIWAKVGKLVAVFIV